MCKSLKWTVTVLFFLVSVAALVGVYQTHVLLSSDGARMSMQFGTTSGSLAIMAFVAAVTCWMKQMVSCMTSCEVCS